MNSKLTLTLEQDIIEKAKRYAKSKGRSLSGLVASYFKLLTAEEEFDSLELAPKTKSLFGAVTLPEGYDEKEVLKEAIEEKHHD